MPIRIRQVDAFTSAGSPATPRPFAFLPSPPTSAGCKTSRPK